MASLLGLTVGLLLVHRLRHEHYAGFVQEVTQDGMVLDVLDGPEDEGEDWTVRGVYGLSLPQPPSTLHARISGTQMSKFVFLSIPLPGPAYRLAVKGARSEIQHRFLDLPHIGPVIGSTTYKFGPHEWQQPKLPLYGLIGSLAIAPVLLWGILAGIGSIVAQGMRSRARSVHVRGA
jgi:hypothetical protein